MKIYLTFLLLSFVIPACADSPAKLNTCIACHGKTGISNSGIYPNLAGQKKPYLIASIKAYRNGTRTGGLSVLMKPIVANLTEEEIVALSKYYSEQILK